MEAVRRAYDAVASAYAELVPDLSVEAPLDRAVLAAFVEMLSAEPDALVVDVGCGTGRVLRHLHDAGLRAVGLDVSPGMLALARQEVPVPLAAADARAVPLRDGVVDGLVAWYAIIHLPAAALRPVFAELARVARAGAPLLLAFSSGEGEQVERATSYGRTVPLTYHRHRVQDVAAALQAAGFLPYAEVRREAVLAFETTPQALLLVRRTGTP